MANQHRGEVFTGAKCLDALAPGSYLRYGTEEIAAMQAQFGFTAPLPGPPTEEEITEEVDVTYLDGTPVVQQRVDQGLIKETDLLEGGQAAVAPQVETRKELRKSKRLVTYAERRARCWDYFAAFMDTLQPVELVTVLSIGLWEWQGKNRVTVTAEHMRALAAEIGQVGLRTLHIQALSRGLYGSRLREVGGQDPNAPSTGTHSASTT